MLCVDLYLVYRRFMWRDNRIFFFLVFLVLLKLQLAYAENVFSRKLNVFVNPGCEDEEYHEACSNISTILYVNATGPSDMLHILSSTMGGVPCILIVRTSLDDQLKINWTQLQKKENGAIKFNQANFSYGLVLSKLWEFEDEHDLGYMTNVTQQLNLTDLSWNDVNYTTGSPDIVTAKFTTVNGTKGFSINGSLTVMVSISGKAVYSKDFPHLKYTGNSTQLSFVIDRAEPYFNYTRLGMEFVAITEPNDSEEWQNHSTSSIDDEYTPGVFTTYQMTMSRSKAFLYWKPLAYTSPDHTVMDSTDVVLYSITNDTDISYNILAAYFNDTHNIHKAAWNLSLGAVKDGFYTKTNYSAWSLMTGLGQPPPDEISNVAIIYIAIGLGLPFLIMLAGGIYLGWKRITRKEDDLLLSRNSIQ